MKNKMGFVLSLLSVFAMGNAIANEEKVGVTSVGGSLSPGGTEVVFSADFDGAFRIWASSLDGSRLRKMSMDQGAALSVTHSEPAWSPDGRHIAYVAVSDGATDIWVMQADGAHPARLTANSARNTQPAWSPDGRKIAFVSDKRGTKDIWTMNADGTQQASAVVLPGEENNPSFSPAGDKIVFSETENDGARLMVANADGTGVRSLTPAGFHDWEPHWGARGILFSSNREAIAGRWRIWLIQPDGSGLRKMGSVAGLDPRWLPDGRVLFTDEAMNSRALAAVSILDSATGLKQVVADVQGYPARIDVRPGKANNSVNPRSSGKIAVAILSTPTFDAPRAVDLKSISFGRTGSEPSLSRCNKPAKDVNSDGIPDLVCRFNLNYAGFTNASSGGVLRFLDVKGVPFEGRDSVSIVAADDPDDFID